MMASPRVKQGSIFSRCEPSSARKKPSGGSADSAGVEATGAVRLIRLERAEPEVLERFYRLEAAGWKAARGTAIACDARTRAHTFRDSTTGGAPGSEPGG